MLRITCPYCGPRPEPEFRSGGDATRVRPSLDASDSEWAKFLYAPANTKGILLERWYHVHGCGEWFVVKRDTVTHAIEEAESAGLAREADR